MPKLRGGAAAGTGIKTVLSDEREIQTLISILRSLEVFSDFSDHKLCKLKPKKTEENLCSFCLLRSLVFKYQSTSGRKAMKPVELLAIIKDETLNDSPLSNLRS